ncbi:MAG: tripartite tricarboxylate transporter substrate binding protein [Aquisalimonadaceae bacterium]
MKKSMLRRLWLPMAMAVLTVYAASTAVVAAADYPDKPITFIVNFGTGGQFDTVSRAIARPLEKHFGQPVVVRNVTGGGGTVGMTAISRADPDGYTVGLLASGMLTMAPHRMNLAYTIDSFNAFRGLGNVLIGIAVAEDSPFKTLEDLVEVARERRVNVSNTGMGGAPTMFVELLNQRYGTQLVSIPAKGGGEGVAAVLGGHTEAILSNTSIITGGSDLRLLASVSSQRWPNAADVPTAQEQGYDVAVDAFLAIGGPADVPQEIADAWVEAIEAALEDPDFVQVAERFSMPFIDMSGDEFKAWAKEAKDDYEPIIKAMD